MAAHVYDVALYVAELCLFWLIIFLTGILALLIVRALVVINRHIRKLPVMGLWPSQTLLAWFVAQPFVFASFFIGMMAGLSRSPALGTVLPAILTLLGGMLAWLVARDRPAQLFAAAAVPGITLALFAGAVLGASQRESSERSYEARREANRYNADLIRERTELLARAEARMRSYREMLQLPNPNVPMIDIMLAPADARSTTR